MTLRDAIRIALDNSEIVRVISFGGSRLPIGSFEPIEIDRQKDAREDEAHDAPIVIARLKSDASIWRFKAEVMAHLRSVEQQYWNLAQAHVQLWAADRAVTLAEEILNREQAELHAGRGTVADVAEAQQRLEQFRIDLVTRTSDVITTERQLRNLLGLPPADDRRIIPVTPPIQARLEPDWDSSLAQMLGLQPDIVQQRTLVRAAELCLLMNRRQSLPLLGPDTLHEFQGLGNPFDCVEATVIGAMFKALSPLIAAWRRGEAPDPGPDSSKEFTTWQVGLMYPMPMGATRYPLANTRQAQYALCRSRARYQQIVHQTTHSLARFFLEIDANYKQFQTATRMRKAAAQRLDAQRAYYEEGRITIDRFLDAVSQYATAVATEAQYKTAYNISILALEEAKGTLLSYDNIVVADGPRPRKALPQAAKSRDAVKSNGTEGTDTPIAPVKSVLAQSVRSDRANSIPSKPDKTVITASFEVEEPKEVEVPPARAQCPSEEPRIATATKGKTWTFSFSIGGANPLEIKGTITTIEGAPSQDGH